MEAFLAALPLLDYAAVAVFGAAGAVAAARQGRDIITFAFFAAVAGVGGGTLRDLLIDAPVFWVQQPQYLLLAVGAAGLVWVFGPGSGRLQLLLWLDSLGMAAYAVVGAAKALSLGAHPVIATVMGVLTATFGGIVRDVLANEPNVLLRKEIYITPALLGAGLFTALVVLKIAAFWPAALAGFLAAFLVRACGLVFGWSLPGFRRGLLDRGPG